MRQFGQFVSTDDLEIAGPPWRRRESGGAIAEHGGCRRRRASADFRGMPAAPEPRRSATRLPALRKMGSLRMKHRFQLSLSLCLFVFQAALAGCAAERAERWRAAQAQNTVQAYRQFISDNPRSEFAEEARSRLRTIYADEERTAYEKAVGEDTVEAYKGFLDRYGGERVLGMADPANISLTIHRYGTFRKDVEGRLKVAIERTEALDWREAMKDDSVDSYHTFLAKHPQGQHSPEARRRSDQKRRETEERVAAEQPIDSAFVATVRTATLLPEVQVPTGEMQMRGNGNLEPVRKRRKPLAGNVFLNLVVVFNNPGPKLSLSRSDIQLLGSGNAYAPFTWYEDLGLLAMQSERFDVGKETVLNMTAEVPRREIPVLRLKVKNRAMGDLKTLGMKL